MFDLDEMLDRELAEHHASSRGAGEACILGDCCTAHAIDGVTIAGTYVGSETSPIECACRSIADHCEVLRCTDWPERVAKRLETHEDDWSHVAAGIRAWVVHGQGDAMAELLLDLAEQDVSIGDVMPSRRVRAPLESVASVGVDP